MRIAGVRTLVTPSDVTDFGVKLALIVDFGVPDIYLDIVIVSECIEKI